MPKLAMVGWGFNRVANRVEALMWVMSERECLLACHAQGRRKA
jgi:hypothetical protein